MSKDATGSFRFETLHWPPRPGHTRVVPTIALTPGLFAPLDDPASLHLIGGRCETCDRLHFPAQDTCPYCGADSCRQTRLSRSGTVYLATTVTARPPGYEGDVPYGFGVVELEGIRVISRIVDPDNARPGSRVEITLETVGTDADGNEIVTYAFGPTGGGNGEPAAADDTSGR